MSSPITGDQAIADAIRADAQRLAGTIQEARRCGLDVTVTFRMEDRLAGLQTLGKRSESQIVVTPEVDIRRITVVTL